MNVLKDCGCHDMVFLPPDPLPGERREARDGSRIWLAATVPGEDRGEPRRFHRCPAKRVGSIINLTAGELCNVFLGFLFTYLPHLSLHTCMRCLGTWPFPAFW